MSRGRASRLPFIALWTVGPVGWVLFVALLVPPCQCWFWGALALPGDGLTGMVVGWNCGGSSGTGFGRNESVLYQTNCQVLILLSFCEADCWVSLARFSKLSFGDMSLPWSLVHLLPGPLKASLPTDMSTEGWPLGYRARSRMPGTLVISHHSGIRGMYSALVPGSTGRV